MGCGRQIGRKGNCLPGALSSLLFILFSAHHSPPTHPLCKQYHNMKCIAQNRAKLTQFNSMGPKFSSERVSILRGFYCIERGEEWEVNEKGMFSFKWSCFVVLGKGRVVAALCLLTVQAPDYSLLSLLSVFLFFFFFVGSLKVPSTSHPFYPHHFINIQAKQSKTKSNHKTPSLNINDTTILNRPLLFLPPPPPLLFDKTCSSPYLRRSRTYDYIYRPRR